MRKDVYAGMAPATYVRQLGAPRRAPMVTRVKKRRGKRRNEVAPVRTAKIDECFAYLESKYDPELAEVWDIYRTSIKDQRRAVGDEACAVCHVDIKHVYDVIEDGDYDLIVCLGCKADELGVETKARRRHRDDHDSRTHPPLVNKPGKRNWVEDRGGLPSYVTRVAKHIVSDSGYTESRAIASAVNVMKRRAAKGNAAAAASLARWSAMKGSK